MMLAKIYCVHLINNLGYDLLFSDVDVIWRRNPLEFFDARKGHDDDFDMYFQDDGARSDRYAPYSPNTGFYFVRHNAKTVFFFNSFVKMGDAVIMRHSHQEILNQMITDSASSWGLRIKVFGRESELGMLFPGGWHYHRRPEFLKDVVQKKADPYIFHMSWTESHHNKVKFFQQMGEWYLNPQCDGKTVSEITDGTASSNVPDLCCAKEALTKCHYRDKPSIIPCKDSEALVPGKASFW